jgi:Kef-type K+ transport system membrane component KefB
LTMPMLSFLTESVRAIRGTIMQQPVFGIGLLLAGSWLLGRRFASLRLPAITGFILTGVILGPSVLDLVHTDLHDELGIITEVALAVIAVAVGSELAPLRLKRKGAKTVALTLIQLLATLGAVTAALTLLGLASPAEAVLLGAIAAATAPAATVALVRELKARGGFVRKLYEIVSLDDAGCVLLFSIAAVFTPGMLRGSEGAASNAMMRLGVSAAIGWVFGFVIHRATLRSRRMNDIYIISLALICIMTALADSYNLSTLLAGLTAGAFLANRKRGGRKVVNALEELAPPLYAAFFAIAGTELTLGGIASPAMLYTVAAVVLSRVLGKQLGTRWGASAVRENSLLKRYMGTALLPQGGVAVGLALCLQSSPAFRDLPGTTSMIVTVTLLSVLLNELLTPPLSRWAISKGSTL